MCLSLDPNDIKIDSAFMERIPYSLAAYYLALPLGYEDGFLSLAIAHPENRTALTVLQDLFGVSIIPVRAAEKAIRDALVHLYDPTTAAAERILAWGSQKERSATALEIASAFVSAKSDRVSILSTDVELDTVLTVFQEGQYTLGVLSPPDCQSLAPLLSGSPASMFFHRDANSGLRRILMVLRGYSSDRFLLDRLAPLLRQKNHSITLLPIDQRREVKGRATFTFGDASMNHLQDLISHPALFNNSTTIKFRQGHSVSQAIDEIVQGDYDLVMTAAEGYGDFVGRILSALDESNACCPPSVFVCKPPFSDRLR